MIIAEGSIVFIHYTLSDEQGQTIDSSVGGQPLPYLHGHHNIVPGLENALGGGKAGDRIKVTVAPEDGYGQIIPEAIQTFPLDAFENVDEIQPGMQFHAEGPDGQVQVLTVKEVNAETIVIDNNHPMAGKVLNFDVEITAVREATATELEQGHPQTEKEESCG
jgi:FKBP-type peptidyl-prolyl cis-trans isomerase SlyD